jgi:pimeloyl-ACP methyl ester carboxylesterase
VATDLPGHDSAGSGPAVVFAHGTAMDRTMFAAQLAALGGSQRAISFDLRARTDRGTSPYDLDDLVDDTVALLDGLDIDRCVLAGMSMGGFMALRFALRHPERLDGLILVDTIASAPSSPAAALYERLLHEERLPEDFVDWLADKVFGATTKRDNGRLVEHWKQRWRLLTGPSVHFEARSWLHREDLTERLWEIAVPTLVVHGEEEEIFPLPMAAEMAALMPTAHLVPIREAGHTANCEQPEAVNVAIGEFLAEVHA